MPTRYTMKDLEKWSDYDLLVRVVGDRMESLTNPYTPLSQRLQRLRNKLSNRGELTK